MLSSVVLFPTSLILVVSQFIPSAVDEQWLGFLGPQIDPYAILLISSLILLFTILELRKSKIKKKGMM